MVAVLPCAVLEIGTTPVDPGLDLVARHSTEQRHR
jgi:hypothetical protein